jgi:hypothetical protein
MDVRSDLDAWALMVSALAPSRASSLPQVLWLITGLRLNRMACPRLQTPRS